MTEINGTLNWMNEEKKTETEGEGKKSNDSCGMERRGKMNHQIAHTARPAQENTTKCKEKESLYATIIIVACAGCALCTRDTKIQNINISCCRSMFLSSRLISIKILGLFVDFIPFYVWALLAIECVFISFRQF